MMANGLLLFPVGSYKALGNLYRSQRLYDSFSTYNALHKNPLLRNFVFDKIIAFVKE